MSDRAAAVALRDRAPGWSIRFPPRSAPARAPQSTPLTQRRSQQTLRKWLRWHDAACSIPPPQGEGGRPKADRVGGKAVARADRQHAIDPPPLRSLTLASTLPLRGRDGVSGEQNARASRSSALVRRGSPCAPLRRSPGSLDLGGAGAGAAEAVGPVH